jgi:hypothetical protein
MNQAESSAFITLACMLWAFHILPPLDEHGQEIPLDAKSDTAFEPGSMIIAKRFRLRLVPRSALIEETIRREWGDACSAGLILGGARVTG